MIAKIASSRVAEGGCLQEEPPQHLNIVGPRGVGKTSLLTWMQRIEKPEEIMAVRWAYVKGKTSGNTLEALLDELIGKQNSESRTEMKLDLVILKINREWKQGQPQKTRFRQIMAERLKHNPVLLLLDEVMHYDKDLLAEVLQECQRLSSEGWPLALILAGTSALYDHLRDVDATFVHRSKDLFINELSDEAVHEALREPFEQRGIKVTDEALELMAGWTKNYPYFTQIVGEMVWKAKENHTEIDVPLAEKALPAIQKECRNFYGKVYGDISKVGLLRYASQMVAIIEESDSSLSPEDAIEKLIAANNGMGEEKANEIFLQLLDQGLCWLKDHRQVERGIPSFFTYFKSQYKPRNGRREKGWFARLLIRLLARIRD